MKRRQVVHDEMARIGRWIYTWCGRSTTTKSLVHKGPDCKVCRRAVRAYRKRESRASSGQERADG